MRIQHQPEVGPVAATVRELAQSMASTQAAAQTQLTELQVLLTLPRVSLFARVIALTFLTVLKWTGTSLTSPHILLRWPCLADNVFSVPARLLHHI